MNRDEAKRVLILHRGEGVEPPDAETAEALRMVQHDQELRHWYEEQLALQAQIQGALRRIPVPDELRSRILSQHRITPLWRQPAAAVALAAASLFVALGVWIFFWMNRTGEEKTFAGFRSRMVRFALREYRMDIVTNDLSSVRRFLSARGAPAADQLPPKLLAAPVKGGARLSWQGEPVSMVCFDWFPNKTLYLFVMRSKALAGETPGETPTVRPINRLTTVSWEQNGAVYLLAGPVDAETLQRLVTAMSRPGNDVFPLAHQTPL